MRGKLLGVCFLFLAVLVLGCGGSEEDRIAGEIDALKKEMDGAKGDLQALTKMMEKVGKITEKIAKSSLPPEKKKALMERLGKGN